MNATQLIAAAKEARTYTQSMKARASAADAEAKKAGLRARQAKLKSKQAKRQAKLAKKAAGEAERKAEESRAAAAKALKTALKLEKKVRKAIKNGTPIRASKKSRSIPPASHAKTEPKRPVSARPASNAAPRRSSEVSVLRRPPGHAHASAQPVQKSVASRPPEPMPMATPSTGS